MSRVTTPRLKEFYPQLSNGATPNRVSLKGRILTVEGINPNYNYNKPASEKNTLMKTEQVVMLPNRIKESLFLTLISENPLSFSIAEGAKTQLPTGYLDGRKEITIAVDSRTIVTDGAMVGLATEPPKDLSRYLVEG